MTNTHYLPIWQQDISNVQLSNHDQDTYEPRVNYLFPPGTISTQQMPLFLNTKIPKDIVLSLDSFDLRSIPTESRLFSLGKPLNRDTTKILPPSSPVPGTSNLPQTLPVWDTVTKALNHSVDTRDRGRYATPIPRVTWYRSQS